MNKQINIAFYLFVLFLQIFGVISQTPKLLHFKSLLETYDNGGCKINFLFSFDIDLSRYIFDIDFGGGGGSTTSSPQYSMFDGTGTVGVMGISIPSGTLPLVATLTDLNDNLNVHTIQLGYDFQCFAPSNLQYESLSAADYQNILQPFGILYYFRVRNFERYFETAGCSSQQPNPPYGCFIYQSNYEVDPSLFHMSILPIYTKDYNPSPQFQINTPVSQSLSFTSLLQGFGSLQLTNVTYPPSVFHSNDLEPASYFLFNVSGGDTTNLLFTLKPDIDSTMNGFITVAPVQGDQFERTYLVRYLNFPYLSTVQASTVSIYNGLDDYTQVMTVLNLASNNVYSSNGNAIVEPFDSYSFLLQLDFNSITATEFNFFIISNNRRFPTVSYPFGYSSGDLKNYRFSMSFLTNQYEKISLSSFDVYHSSPFSVQIPSYTTNPKVVDQYPPIIHNIESFRINNTFILMRFNISDDYSGFGMLQIGQADDFYTIELLPQHLVKGDLNNGIYEVITDTLFKSFYSLFMIDRSSSYIMFSEQYKKIYNMNGQTINLLQDNLTPQTINLFYFKKSVVDLTLDGYNNTLYLNFTGAGPHSKVFFDTLLNTYDHGTIQKDPSYYHYWDNELNLIRIDFYLPKGLVSGPINYIFGCFKALSYTTIYQIVGTNSTLLVVSDSSASQLPPIVDVISSPTNPVTLGKTGSQLVGWDVVVSTPIRDLKKAIFRVTSDYDLVGHGFQFTPSPGPTNNFQIRFPVVGDARTQNYTISFAYFEDAGGLKSGHNNAPWIDAFFKVEIPYLIVNCDPITDTQGPELLSFKSDYNASTYSLVGPNRKITYDFEVYDASGIETRLDPKIYLSGTTITMSQLWIQRKTQYQCKNQIISSNSTNVIYKAICDVPFGLGYPDGLLVSIYGIVDKYLNIRGYSSHDLKTKGIDPFINGSIPMLSPVIESSKEYNGVGALQLGGFRFGFNSNDIIIEIMKQGGEFIEYTPTSFNYFNSFSLSFDYQTTEPFKIRLKNDVDQGYSNEYLIDPWNKWDDSSSSSSSVSESSNSVISSSAEPPKCPGNPKCGGGDKGICLNTGGCKCNYPYYGEQCTSVIVIIPTPKPNPEEPSTNTTIEVPGSSNQVQLSTLVSVVSLKEIDNNGNDIKTFTFSRWIYTSLSPDLHLYETSIVNNNITTNITVTIEFFNQTKTIYFAGQNLTMNPSTLKYKISMTEYSFQSSVNHLKFIMSALITASSNDDGCTYKEFNAGSESSDYLRLQLDNYSLYGRFIKVGLIDNRPTTITNDLLDSQFKQLDQSNTKSSSQSYIGISIPFYKRSVIIDPDFSVLLDSDKARDKEGSICESKSSSALSAAKIAGIVIGCVAFVSIIVISVIYHLYKKKKSQKMIRGMEAKLKAIKS